MLFCGIQTSGLHGTGGVPSSEEGSIISDDDGGAPFHRSAVIMAQMTMLRVTVFAMMRMMTMLNFVMDISLVHFHMYGTSFCLTTENDTACCACYYCELDDSMFHIACTGLHALHPYKRTSKVFLFKI